MLNSIPCFWSKSKLMIETLAPESGRASMEKLVLVLLSSWDTVTRTFGVDLLDDDVMHTAMEVRLLAGLGDLVLLL